MLSEGLISISDRVAASRLRHWGHTGLEQWLLHQPAPVAPPCTTLHRPAPVPFHAFFCFTPLAGKSEPLMKKRRPLFFISGPLFFKSGPHRKKYGPLVKQYNYSSSDNHPPHADAIPVQVVQAGASGADRCKYT